MNWFTSIFSGKTTSGDVISASTMNITKIISIPAAACAAFTQALEASNQIELTAGQMVAIWLTVAGLIVVLAITDMACRAYVTGKSLGLGGEALLTDLGLTTFDVDVSDASSADGHKEAYLIGIVAGATPPRAHVRYKEVPNKVKAHDEYVALSRVHEHS